MTPQGANSLELTQAEVVFLEAHNVHCPLHAWAYINEAIALKIGGLLNQAPQDFLLLVGICQKVNIGYESRLRFRKLYQSAWYQGLFNKDVANPARVSPYA